MLEKNKLGVIIFSRFDSKRLYGKALTDIEGKCLLGRVIERCRLISEKHKIIVATSKRAIDDSIAKFAIRDGVEIYRGSCNDVYSRSIETCNKFNLDAFVRICGDRPFFDFNLVSKAINIFENSNYDLVTSMFPRTYPPGLTTEIINRNLLEKYNNLVKDKFDREHLTTFFYKNAKNIKIKNLQNIEYEKIKDIKLVVDNNIDLKRARWIALNENKRRDKLTISEIISLASEFDAHINVE